MKGVKIRNLLGVLLVICASFSFYFGGIIKFTFVQAISMIAVLFLSILLLTVTAERTEKQELPEGQGEMDPAFKQAAHHLAVVKYTLFLTAVCSVIGFGLTNRYEFLFVLAGSAVPYGVLRITYVINLLWK